MTDLSIRRVSIAEHADLCAQRCAATGEPQLNPHCVGTEDFAAWQAAFVRALQRYTQPEAEGSA